MMGLKHSPRVNTIYRTIGVGVVFVTAFTSKCSSEEKYTFIEKHKSVKKQNVGTLRGNVFLSKY